MCFATKSRIEVNLTDFRRGYANWTSSGWALRVHGLSYKEPPLNNTELDDAADIFLPGLNTSNLTTSQRTESRNVTKQLLSLPWKGEVLNFTLVQPNGGDHCGTCSPVNVTLKTPTTDAGDFDEIVVMGKLEGVADGNGTGAGFVTKLDLLSTIDPSSKSASFTFESRFELICPAFTVGNASSYFVPEEGLTIISDIDDILRVTKIYQPGEGLQNSFANNYTAWMNMPQVYQTWNNITGGQDATIAGQLHSMTLFHAQACISTTSRLHPSKLRGPTSPLCIRATHPVPSTTDSSTSQRWNKPCRSASLDCKKLSKASRSASLSLLPTPATAVGLLA